MYDVPEIHVTTEYDMFQKLDGNRQVQKTRENKIRRSIRQVGQMPVPLLVNEKMQIIDGQARHSVYKELGLPIYYIIVKGLGIRECVAMNISGTNWTMTDYLKSHAAMGNESYVRLLRLVNEYPEIKLTNIICAATGLMSVPSPRIQDGSLEVTQESMDYARELLDYVLMFMPYIKEAHVSNEVTMVNALIFAYQCEQVDRQRLYESISRNYRKLSGFSRIDECLECISEIYNLRRKVGRVYLETEYRKVMEDSYSWYAKKWGKH